MSISNSFPFDEALPRVSDIDQTMASTTAFNADIFSHISYSQDLAAVSTEIAEVNAYLASVRAQQDSMSQALWQVKEAVTKINNRLAAFPPAKAPGTVFPPDHYDQVLRAGHTFERSILLDQTIEVVQAEFIPQPSRKHPRRKQYIPTALLKHLGLVSLGKNSSQLYSSLGRVNTRAKEHLLDQTQEVYGNVIYVEHPLQTESWFPLHVPNPVHDLKGSVEALHRLSIFRFTIDTLEGGGLILSFAKENDPIIAMCSL